MGARAINGRRGRGVGRKGDAYLQNFEKPVRPLSFLSLLLHLVFAPNFRPVKKRKMLPRCGKNLRLLRRVNVLPYRLSEAFCFFQPHFVRRIRQITNLLCSFSHGICQGW